MAKEGKSRAGTAWTDGRGGTSVALVRGAGKVQRRIWRAFMSLPGAELTTADLAAWCYPRSLGEPDRHQRRAIVRAAARVATRVRRDRPGGVVFRALDSNSVSNQALSSGNSESAQ